MKTLEKTQGNRRPDGTMQHDLENGEYSKVFLNGEWTWFIKTPTGIIGWLKNHKCIENEDGTLSVLPPIQGEGPNSILAQEYNGSEIKRSWHGFIYNGIWKEIG